MSSYLILRDDYGDAHVLTLGFTCSTQQDAVGCVWSWFVDSSTTSQDTRPTQDLDDTSHSSSGTGEWCAPHHVIYADRWLGTMPDVSVLGDFNRFILAFWEAGTGAVDNVQAWASWDKSYRDRVTEAYHEAGIAIMVAAFGSTDLPTTSEKDAKQVAEELASFVKAYDLDGVDIDYEGRSILAGLWKRETC